MPAARAAQTDRSQPQAHTHLVSLGARDWAAFLLQLVKKMAALWRHVYALAVRIFVLLAEQGLTVQLFRSQKINGPLTLGGNSPSSHPPYLAQGIPLHLLSNESL